jgi:hypothetical protein
MTVCASRSTSDREFIMAIETVGIIAAYMVMSAGIARSGGFVANASSSRPIYSVSQAIPEPDAVGYAPKAKSHLKAHAHPSDLDRLIGHVNSFLCVADGWDSDDAVAPPNAAVSDAIEFLVRYALLPRTRAGLPNAMLSSHGTVGLYWHSADSYLDVEFAGDGMFSRFERNQSLKALTENLAITADSVMSVIDATNEWPESASST